MKKTISIIFLISMLFCSSFVAYAEPADELALVGQSAILIAASTGQVLYEKSGHALHYPASTTKIMTAILALENLKLTDKIPIDAETPFTEGSRIYLLEGEEVTVEEVLYGLLLESANDSAVALAKMISGSVEEFAKKMNEKAKEVGATDTNFVNPNGLSDEAHVTTAYDLAMMTRYAMKNEVFRDYVSTYQYTMAATNLQDTRYFYNTNRLLYDNVHKVSVNGVMRTCKYEGITGVKTGYTSEAGGCLVASAKRGDTELIAVTLASTDMGRFGDCIALLDYGFENYKTVAAFAVGEAVGQIDVKRGAVSKVDAILEENAYATLPNEASEDLVRTEIELYDSLKAPVAAGQKAGVVKVYAGDEQVAEYEVFTADAVEKGGLLSYIGISDAAALFIRNIVFCVLGGLLLLLILYIMVRRYQVKKRRLKRVREREELRRKQEDDRARWEEEFLGRRMHPY